MILGRLKVGDNILFKGGVGSAYKTSQVYLYKGTVSHILKSGRDVEYLVLAETLGGCSTDTFPVLIHERDLDRIYLESDVLYASDKGNIMNSNSSFIIVEKKETSHGRVNPYEKDELELFKALATKFGYELED